MHCQPSGQKKKMKNSKIEPHIRQTHKHTHTSSDLSHKDVQWLSLFIIIWLCCADA